LFLFVVAYTHPTDAIVREVSVAKEEGPVDIEADELIYERETQIYQAHGQVEVYRGNFSLKADHAQLNMETKDLVAWGNVLLREGEDVVECQRLEVNLETQLGKIHEARLFLKEQNFHITGKEAEKLGENHYRIRDGSLTTCDAKRPPWKFTVKELEVKEMAYGGWRIAKGAMFYLEDIPVLYFPWGAFPVRQERQTGFLLPQVGYSDKYGPEVKAGFYWAFAKNMDATFYLDYLGDRGFKEGLEYRYAFTRETEGQAKFYFIDDQAFNKNDEIIHKNRYAFFVQHQQKLPYDFYLKGDIYNVSDHAYLSDFDEDLQGVKIDSRSSIQLRSVLFGGKNWEQFSFLVDNEVFDNLTQTSNDETVQKLPQVSFYAHPQSVPGIPLFFDLTSSYTNFWREKGVETQRGDLYVRLSYPVRLFNVLKFESDIGVRETYYKPSYNYYHYNNITIPNKDSGYPEAVESTDHYPGLQYRKPESRETLEAGMQISTEFYRFYRGEMISKITNLFKVSKWMHTIEPMISYQYSPRVNQDDIPIFDEVDRILYTNQVTFGITQRLIGKPEKEGVSSGPREYGKLIISQSYSFGDPYEDNRNDNFGNPFKFVLKEKQYFSNIRGELWLNFNPYVTAHWDAELNPNRWGIDRFNFTIKAEDRRGDVFRVQYRNTQGSSIQEIIFDPRATAPPFFYPYLDTSGGVRAINLDARVKTIEPLYFFGGIRYNLLDHFNVVSTFGVEYRHQCWSSALAVEYWGEPPSGIRKKELKVNLYFNLLNIGSRGRTLTL
jgi:LPS-assembly protein